MIRIVEFIKKILKIKCNHKYECIQDYGDCPYLPLTLYLQKCKKCKKEIVDYDEEQFKQFIKQ